MRVTDRIAVMRLFAANLTCQCHVRCSKSSESKEYCLHIVPKNRLQHGGNFVVFPSLEKAGACTQKTALVLLEAAERGQSIDQRLEQEFESKLHNARRYGAVLDLSKRRIGHVVDWRIKLRVIPNVVPLGSELQRHRFGDFRVLDERDVPVKLPRTKDRPHSRISEAPAAART
jgi:hypothetical protein